jgi:hypothetical protein
MGIAPFRPGQKSCPKGFKGMVFEKQTKSKKAFELNLSILSKTKKVNRALKT